VSPASLSFGATCGGAAPAPQTFVVENGGNGDMEWTMGAPQGPGAARYALSASPPPGTLAPGASAVVTVSAVAMPSPEPSADPSTFAAQVTIATNVPLDPPHVVALGETPLGDRLAFSGGPIRFGQVPVGATIAQSFAVTSTASSGSAAPSFSFVVGGAGAGAYSASLEAGGGLLAFAPSAASAYPAALSLTTSDPLCEPLPPPLSLSGTGSLAQVALSATTLAFGTDPSDPSGLVDCGKTGLARTLVVSNVGNQAFDVTQVALGGGGASVFSVAGAEALPLSVPIGGSASFVVTPSPIPAIVADPGDASPFSDTLTVTTDASHDSPHVVALVMQARGAVVTDGSLPTIWAFGAVPHGSIGTIAHALTNTGNAAVSVSLTGLAQPRIFGLRTDPTVVAAGSTGSIVAQFVPPSANGAWSDQGTLSVTPVESLCAPLPASWTNPTITLSGSSTSTP
jgi:hypothetical protein